MTRTSEPAFQAHPSDTRRNLVEIPSILRLSTDSSQRHKALRKSAHGLGHAADIIYSDQSNNSTLETYVAQDYLYLDYSTVGSSAGTSTARPPCGTGGVFTGLNDESTGKAFCVTSATTGYTKIGTNLYLESKYVSGGKPLQNSQIIQQASRMFAWGGDGWLELYAQAFGFEAYVTTLSSGYVYYTADPVLKAGYFVCQLDWSYDVLNNFAVPPASAPHPYPAANGFGTCNSVPTWYRTLLGH